MHTRLARRHSRQALTTVAAIIATTALLAGCSGNATPSGTTAGATKFSMLINADNTGVPQELKALSTNQCKTENTALPYDTQTVPQAGLDQKLQLLGGQNALPAQFAAGGAPAQTKSLDKSGQTLDLTKTLKDLGAYDNIEPAAVSTINNLYGKFIVLPYQFNVEGIWYNKKMFADEGIAVPKTWDEMVAAAGKLKSSGVTAFSASGVEGWPITRLISGYLYRELGPDALKDVADGKAKLTDPEYVKAAQAVADLGKAGYFGEGVGSIDYATGVSQFLTGKAGMLYMGSWVLPSMNDPKQNLIGADNVGFMPLPTVAGGKGSADQIPANVGLPIAVSAKSYNPKVGAWLKCISANFGAASLKDQGAITGFKVNGDSGTVPPLTKVVQDTIAKTTVSTLWFEALFSVKATTTSQHGAAPLVTGAMSAKDFMASVQADLGSQ
ncbi:ABC transporter substrate-binding protein [Lacisediminihabitans sp. FW035]